MATVSIRLKVSDYAKWKAVYEEVKPLVKSKGGERQILLRNSSDSSELVVLSEIDYLNYAKQFAQSEELKQAMHRALVAEVATIFFLEELENVTL